MKKILIVDDEIYLLKSIIAILTNKYQLVSASDGKMALSIIKKHHGKFDAIICDLNMPIMHGADLYRHLSCEYPGMEQQMVFISGGVYTPLLSDFVLNTKNFVLKKPFSKEQLFNTIDKMI